MRMPQLVTGLVSYEMDAEMKILSLCSGYGGLDMAVEQHFSAKTAYWSDIDKTACDVMAARFPDAQPIGDLTTLDLTMIHADVVTAGYPCQPFSTAGKRKGTNDERHLWPYIRNTISVLRPKFVVLENVSGHVSLGAASVVGDLAALGYDAKWTVVRASDVGAPHQRKRWFCVATNTDGAGSEAWSDTGQDSQLLRQQSLGSAPFTTNTDYTGPEQERAKRCRGADTTASLITDTDSISTGRHTGTPPGAQTERRNVGQFHNGFENEIGGGRFWRHYWPAIERWERVLGRPAPEPITDGKLSALFVEWMMGLDEGYVTDIAASRAKALACLGNGVVPQQAKRALELLT
jgi:DNA (cytosine-5)-methyltransferase 1